ncbi:MAG: sucrase ferredoxin [Micromonosporaceae bacterium]
MTGSYRCADAALRRSDPLLATAPPVRRWLLIEEPGGWGTDGLVTSPVDPAVAVTVARQAKAAGVRVQLIRRPGRRRNRPALRRYAVVVTEPDRYQIDWGTLRTDDELLDIDLDPPVRHGSGEPIYLVCTHGRKDVCCAMRGRPVAEHLASHRPDATWETTHVGGDRFAANLVLLPHGLYYGQLSGDAALAAVKAYESGLVLPAQLRGRCTQPMHVQAAEWYARLELSETRRDTLVPRAVTQPAPDTWRVSLGRGDDTVIVTVRAVASPLPAQLTCGNPHPEHYRTFELVSLTR